MNQWSVHSPVGDLTITEENNQIIALDWGRSPPDYQHKTPVLAEAADWLEHYFDGTFRKIEFPLNPAGTPFQRAVWDFMLSVPPGSTATYGDTARAVGSAAQPVGTACGANPIPIIIPCHRIVAAGGKLGGYSGAGGVDTKRVLLQLEATLFSLSNAS